MLDRRFPADVIARVCRVRLGHPTFRPRRGDAGAQLHLTQFILCSTEFVGELGLLLAPVLDEFAGVLGAKVRTYLAFRAPGNARFHDIELSQNSASGAAPQGASSASAMAPARGAPLLADAQLLWSHGIARSDCTRRGRTTDCVQRFAHEN